MTDKRIPKPGEVWTDEGIRRTVVNVYPDCVTYTLNDGDELWVLTLDAFLDASNPPEPTVVRRETIVYSAGQRFVSTTEPQAYFGRVVGTIAAMSDGTFRFEAAS